MSNWIERTANLKAGEGRLAVLGAAQFFLLMFAYFMLRPLREAMGLAGGVDELSTLYLINVGVMIVLNPLYGWLASRAQKRRLTVIVYRVAIGCLGVFATALWDRDGDASSGVGQAFYVWLSVFNVFVVSLFWQLMADLQDPAQSKRVFGIVAVGGTLGAMAGSAWAWGLAATIGPIWMMAGSAVLLEAGARVSLLHRDGAVRGAGERIGGSAWAGLVEVVRSPYLIAIGGYILLHTLMSTFLYFAKMEIVASAHEGMGDRTELFARIEFFGQAATVVLQLLLTGRLMRRFGVGSLMAVVPIVTLGGFIALAAAPTVLALTVFEATRRASHFALGKPARETLFTVLSTEEKYKAKAALDTFVYRAGDSVGALAVKGFARAGAPALWAIAPLCLGAVGVSAWLGRQEAKRERAIGATAEMAPGS